MLNYLNEIEFAVSGMMPLMWAERNQLGNVEQELSLLTRVAEDNYRRAESISLEAEDPDDVMMAAGVYWENYFGDDKKRFHKNEEKEKLVARIDAHRFSIDAIAASILQYAKQGILLTHGGVANCPGGRLIGTQSIRDVIWQARNQAIHWEEGSFRTAVDNCFDVLKNEIDPKYGDFISRNMAGDVVELLGWVDFDSFKTDLLSLS
jgi:hypothetical protein